MIISATNLELNNSRKSTIKVLDCVDEYPNPFYEEQDTTQTDKIMVPYKAFAVAAKVASKCTAKAYSHYVISEYY